MSEHTSDQRWAALARLADTVRARRGADPASSYTASLLAAGPEKCARKLGEEAVETVIALTAGDREATLCEAADLVYHLLVALEASDLDFDQVVGELARREGRGGLDEKASRESG